jgi:hypothetical protein
MSALTATLAAVYSGAVRTAAARLRADGHTWSAISRELGVSRSTLRVWATNAARPARASGCPRCDDTALDPRAYASLLGFYLGDGCISAAARYFFLRVTCDLAYPRIIDDVADGIRAVHPGGNVYRVAAEGCVHVTSNWKHCPCLSPQHGPGRKHERPIVLEDWQRRIVESSPHDFLRGLFHSDGCRAKNWTRRRVAGEWKRYDYPRWQFSNRSLDIRELCCWALDLADIPWRQSNAWMISVSTRAGVARLDELIGPKS